MLVKWNGDGLMAVPLVTGEASQLVGKEGMVWFMPGWNEITDEQWQIISIHVQDHLSSEKMVINGKKEVDKNDPSKIAYTGVSLRDVRADVAKDIVRGCYNLSCLYEWSEDAKLSSEVRFHIEKQIEACEKGEDPKAKK